MRTKDDLIQFWRKKNKIVADDASDTEDKPNKIKSIFSGYCMSKIIVGPDKPNLMIN